LPFQPSPGKDDGHDLSDYSGLDARCGTLGYFVEFAHGCPQRDIHEITDLVVNRTSDQYPWFRARSSRESPYRDWYVGRTTDRPTPLKKRCYRPGQSRTENGCDEADEHGTWPSVRDKRRTMPAKYRPMPVEKAMLCMSMLKCTDVKWAHKKRLPPS
jgi:glycosidase